MTCMGTRNGYKGEEQGPIGSVYSCQVNLTTIQQDPERRMAFLIVEIVSYCKALVCGIRVREPTSSSIRLEE